MGGLDNHLHSPNFSFVTMIFRSPETHTPIGGDSSSFTGVAEFAALTCFSSLPHPLRVTNATKIIDVMDKVCFMQILLIIK